MTSVAKIKTKSIRLSNFKAHFPLTLHFIKVIKIKLMNFNKRKPHSLKIHSALLATATSFLTHPLKQ